jgi:predicted kinase
MKLIAIFGYSRSGKSTIARILSRQGYQHYTMGQPPKDLFERAFNLPAGAMEMDEYRQALFPGSNQTYLEKLKLMWAEIPGTVLADIFHHQRRTTLDKMAQHGNIVIESIRNPEEGEIITDLIKNRDMSLNIIHVIKPGLEPATSDFYQKEIMRQLYLHPYRKQCYTVFNNGSMEDLENEIKELKL